jgi:hypothetical protein
MAMHETFSATDAAFSSNTEAPLSNWIKLAGQRIVKWALICADYINTCADYYAAATMYEQLSKLSNTELARRGLDRETLAQDVRDTCNRIR